MKRVVIEYDETLCNWLVKSEGLQDFADLRNLMIGVGEQFSQIGPPRICLYDHDQRYEVAK